MTLTERLRERESTLQTCTKIGRQIGSGTRCLNKSRPIFSICPRSSQNCLICKIIQSSLEQILEVHIFFNQSSKHFSAHILNRLPREIMFHLAGLVSMSSRRVVKIPAQLQYMVYRQPNMQFCGNIQVKQLKSLALCFVELHLFSDAKDLLQNTSS